MTTVVAVIAPGAMGAAVGRRLADGGLKVLTSLEGRSPETVARAKAARMVGASDDEIAACDFILSILPPGDALALAERFAPALTRSNAKPVYVDCNAINPKTVERVAAAIAPSGAPFVDAGIIGPPPKPVVPGETASGTGTRFYASGPSAPRFASLRDYGLDVRVLDGPLSAASALKMSYAGITKGFTALGATMMLAAARAGTTEALIAEMKVSQPALLKWLTTQMPKMHGKAYRWVAEIEEIAAFVGPGETGDGFYQSAAELYRRIAADFEGPGVETGALDAFCDTATG